MMMMIAIANTEISYYVSGTNLSTLNKFIHLTLTTIL